MPQPIEWFIPRPVLLFDVSSRNLLWLIIAPTHHIRAYGSINISAEEGKC